MLGDILNIVAPVFLVVAAGYSSVRFGAFDANRIDHLMKFAIQVAIPCLLFRATSQLDLDAAFDWRILMSYYTSSFLCFVIAVLVVMKCFRRSAAEAVVIGFAALFSNLVLLGLPISERAWGSASMDPNFALVSLHAPICYLIGITAMELLQADGRDVKETMRSVLVLIFRNSLMIAIALGFIINLSGLVLPVMITSAVDLLARASLPVALFGLGGALTRYTLSRSIGEASLLSILSLIVQPAMTLFLAIQFQLSRDITNSIVLMAAMAPGLNAYLFAVMYNRSVDIAASTVLLSTVLSVLSLSVWLIIL